MRGIVPFILHISECRWLSKFVSNSLKFLNKLFISNVSSYCFRFKTTSFEGIIPRTKLIFVRRPPVSSFFVHLGGGGFFPNLFSEPLEFLYQVFVRNLGIWLIRLVSCCLYRLGP